MNKTLINSLCHFDAKRFEELRDETKSFNSVSNGSNIVQDDIFNIIKNYGRKSKQPIEILRYPVDDSDFCACTFFRKGVLFIVCNTYLPLSKQIFAAAHELYHIIRFMNGEDDGFVQCGSILKSDDIDQINTESEDREANAFAGLFLVPANFLREQMDIYAIPSFNIYVRDVLKLMEIFAIPFKAMVLRLYEERYIDESKANEFLNIDSEMIDEVISITGISSRWQKPTPDLIELGCLNEFLDINTKMGFATETRLEEDKTILTDLINEIKKVR